MARGVPTLNLDNAGVGRSSPGSQGYPSTPVDSPERKVGGGAASHNSPRGVKQSPRASKITPRNKIDKSPPNSGRNNISRTPPNSGRNKISQRPLAEPPAMSGATRSLPSSMLRRDLSPQFAEGDQRASASRKPLEENGSESRDSGRKVVKTVKLHVDGSHAPPPEDNQEIYLSVLKQLLGPEMRAIVQSELQAALSYPRFSVGSEEAFKPQLKPKGDASGPSLVESMDELDADQAHNVDQRLEVLKKDSNGCEEDEIVNYPLSGLPTTARNCLQRLSLWSEKVGVHDAPNQPQCLKGFIEGQRWGSAVNIVILVNCAFMVYSLDYQLKNYQEEESFGTLLFWCDVFFWLFYGVELCLKWVCYGWYYFYGVNWKANWLDFILVMAQTQSILVTVIVSGNQRIQNFTWLRLLRLLRLLKAVRVLKLASSFKTLRAILTSLMDSFWTLVWSLTMLAIIYFMLSLVFVSRIAAHFNALGPDLSQTEFDNLMESFGSVAISMQSLVMASTGGQDWGDLYFLLETTGMVNQIVFIFAIFFVQIALMNIILGIFVEEAMKNLQPDDFQKAQQLAMDEKRVESELRSLCKNADVDLVGKLEEKEWKQIMKDTSTRNLFALLGMSSRHVHELFSMMISRNKRAGQDGVDLNEFVRACMRMKGAASTFDMNEVMFEVMHMKDLLAKELRMTRELLSRSR